MKNIISIINKFKIFLIEKDLVFPILIFGIWFFSMMFIAFQADFRLPDSMYKMLLMTENIPHRVYDWWIQSDADYFFNTASQGYVGGRYMFFPLYPLLILFFSKIANNNFISPGLFVSWISIFVGIILFYKLVKLDYKKDIAQRTILYLLIFPMSFFFLSYYSESLFFLVTVSAFYYARKQNWLLAGIFGFFASLTRLIGVLLLPVLLFEYFYQKKFKFKEVKKDVLSLTLIPLGLTTFCLYLYQKTGDFFAFLHAYNATNWPEKAYLKLNIFKTLYNGLKFLVTFPASKDTAHYAIQSTFIMSTIFVMLVLFGMIIKKIRPSYILYSFFSIIVPLISGSYDSMNRYILVIFPMFIFLAILGKIKVVNYFIVIFSATLLGVFITNFVNNYWVG